LRGGLDAFSAGTQVTFLAFLADRSAMRGAWYSRVRKHRILFGWLRNISYDITYAFHLARLSISKRQILCKVNH